MIIPGGICTVESITRPFLERFMPEIHATPTMHRKQWEFALVAEAIESAGLTMPGSKGLGFGVGIEPMTAWFASHGCNVTATDIAGGWWSNWEATLNDRGICEPTEFAERVTVREADMNWIPSDLRNFDFCWSCCSLDHLGSLRLGKRFIYNSLDCLRPGGVAVHTTEFNLNSDDWRTVDYADTVLWMPIDILEMYALLEKRGHRAAFDWTCGEVDQWQGHVRLWIGEFPATSCGFVIQKLTGDKQWT